MCCLRGRESASNHVRLTYSRDTGYIKTMQTMMIAPVASVTKREREREREKGYHLSAPDYNLVAHVCGDPLSRYTCRPTRVAADFLRILGCFRCSSSIALHPP